MKYDVITFGSAVIDIFAETQSERILRMCEDDRCENYLAYKSGGKALIHELHTDIGGGGTNTAACFKKLGLHVGYGGTISTDQHGETIMKWLSDNEIGFVGARTHAKQNMSIILDSKQLHDRSILAYKDASNKFMFGDLDLGNLQATWFYFSALMGTAYDEMIRAMRYAREHGIAVAFNPSSYLAQQGLNVLSEAIHLSNLLVLNADEARLLLGRNDGNRYQLCHNLRLVGAEIVIVTDGPAGATLLYADTFYSVQPQPTKVVETTGAGDAFAASFVAGLHLGLNPEKALRFSMVNVENLITQVGAKAGLLDRQEALGRLENDDRDVIIEQLSVVS